MSVEIRRIISIVLSIALGLATLVGVSAAPASASPALPANWDGYGLKEIERYVGKYQASTDGFSKYGTTPAQSSGNFQVQKLDAGASVTRAFLSSASGDNGNAISAAPTTTVNGSVVTWGTRNHAGKWTNYLADVTAAVNSTLTNAAAGTIDIPVVYDASGNISTHTPTFSTGVSLTVIFSNPNMTNDASVIYYFGTSNSSGQNMVLSFAELNATPPTGSWLSLGIGWSQGGDNVNAQYSTVKAKNNLQSAFTDLSGSAGGCDDTINNPSACGDSLLGLLTVGGVGDSTANPATISSTAADDELYNMDGFLAQGVNRITLNTTNASGDDNIFQAVLSVPFILDYEANFDSAGGSAVATEFWTTSVRALTNSVRSGYSFDGWFLANGTTAIQFPYTPASFANQQFYAHWTQLTYTASFDTHGGSSVAGIVYTTSITLPAAPTRAGYTFTGWYTAAVGGNYLGITYTPQTPANLTIHAQWYPLPSNNNSGGGSSSSPTPTPTPTATPEPTIEPVVVAPAPKPRKTATLIVAGFADGSPILASVTKAKITKFVNAHKTYKKALCTGYTEGPTVLKGDAALSKQRGLNACDLVRILTGRKISVASVSAVQSTIESAQNRRVKIVLISR